MTFEVTLANHDIPGQRCPLLTASSYPAGRLSSDTGLWCLSTPRWQPLLSIATSCLSKSGSFSVSSFRPYQFFLPKPRNQPVWIKIGPLETLGWANECLKQRFLGCMHLSVGDLRLQHLLGGHQQPADVNGFQPSVACASRERVHRRRKLPSPARQPHTTPQLFLKFTSLVQGP